MSNNIYDISKKALLIVMVACLTIKPLTARENSILTESMHTVLPGSNIKIIDAITEAEIVLVASVVNLGIMVEPLSPGIDEYEFVNIIHLQTLKGDNLLKVRNISFSIRSLPNKRREKLPKINEKYLFFLKKEKKEYKALKIWVADEKLIDCITSIIKLQKNINNLTVRKC